MKTEMAQLQQSAVHNHTAAMLEMGTNLLSQTAEQTRKLTDVETQVLGRPGTTDPMPAVFYMIVSSRFPLWYFLHLYGSTLGSILDPVAGWSFCQHAYL